MELETGVIQLKNIKPQKRICAKCGKKITGRGHHYVTKTGRGKYLCRSCENAKQGIDCDRIVHLIRS